MTGVYFNGYNSYGIVSHKESLTIQGSFTIAVQMKVHRLKSPWAWIINKDIWKDSNYFLILDTKHDINFGFGDGSSSYTVRTYVSLLDYDRVWVIGRYNYETGDLEVLYDDDVVASKNIGSIIPVSNDKDMYLGNSSAMRDRWLNAEVYRVLLWAKYLNDDDITKLITNPDKPPAKDRLVLWLPFTENMGVIAKDYSGNNNHARLYNCKWVSRARRGMYFDNGGIKFDSGLNIDCNYCSVVAVFAIETLAKGGNVPSGRNCIVRPNGDKLMLYNDWWGKYIHFTNYDETWKTVRSNIELEAGQIYTGVGIMNGNEEHIYLASNGVIIDHSYRDDLGDCGEYTNTAIYVGSNHGGKYALHGEVLAVMIYDRPISESEIERISDLGWFDPPRDGLISWILFDGLKEGDEVKDLITGAVGEPIGTPKFVIRKPKRVLTR